MDSTRAVRSPAILCLAATTLALGACEPGAAGDGESISESTLSSRASISTDVTEYFSIGGTLAPDDDPAESIDAIASQSEVGVVGTVIEHSDARFDIADPLASFDFQPVVVRLEVQEMVVGTQPAVSDGSAYLTLAGTASASAYEKALPVGTRVVFYGNDITQFEGDRRKTAISGVPQGQPVYTPASVEGLAFELPAIDAESGAPVPGRYSLVFPWLGAVSPGVTVEAMRPGEDIPLLEYPE